MELTNSENPLRLDSGRKKGYMYVMKELWDDLGYGELGLTAQNLHDQAARMEKSLGSVKGMMDRQIGRGNDTRIENKEESKTENNLCNGDRSQEVVEGNDLHTASDCVLNKTESMLLDSANCILLSVSDNTGDFVK